MCAGWGLGVMVGPGTPFFGAANILAYVIPWWEVREVLILFELEGLGKFLGEIGRVRDALKGLRVEVTEGPVSLTLNGLQEVVRVRIRPEAGKELARLEGWLGACFNKGVAASRQAAKEEIERLTGWTIPAIPGLT